MGLLRAHAVGWLRHRTLVAQSMMPKSMQRSSGDIMLRFFGLETDSDFRSDRPEIIRLRA
ncbi:hypothetical protein FJW05_23295 [Mesorhizobium sp. B2-9-1]|nr:hypothetical protein FJW05_23295 [Mesorhizobium sp. B2-9-1]